MTEQPVLVREIAAGKHRWGHLTLNAPKALNALSREMVGLLDAALCRWADDPDVAGVILDGAGERAFCAGGDIIDMYQAIRAAHAREPGSVPHEAQDFFTHEYRLNHRIHTYPKPFLCWGNGYVMGGGLGLLAGASHRVGTPSTRIAMPEISIGLYPDVAASWFLPRLPGRSGLFLALTAAQLNAHDARFAGLIDFIVAEDSHAELLAAIAATAWSDSPTANAARLSALLKEQTAQLSTGLPDSPLYDHHELLQEIVGHGDDLTALDRNLRALADHEDPWLAKAAKTYMAGSPTSAALAFTLWRQARHASLADALRLEYQTSIGCTAHADFAEGVRALLVDKDRAPRWSPATLAEVTPEWIEDHLAPRFNGAHPLADLA